MPPQRRAPFGYGSGVGDGQSTGTNPLVAMPMTGTGTEGEMEHMDASMGMGMGESPATMRRRLMPVAGPMRREPDVLTAAQHTLAQRGQGQ